MALINCPECNGMVSDTANICPHCGYSISQYINTKLFDSEIERLTNQIKQPHFTCPAPRVKVCIKCGEPFFYTNNTNHPKFDTPMCDCGYPGVEVDYPQQGFDGELGACLYMIDHDIIPRNIGDKESDEYKRNMSSLHQQIEKSEIARKKLGISNWKIVPIPPDLDDFGIYASEEPLKPYTPPTPDPAPLLPRCPFCSSTDLSKISTLKKAAKISVFGLFGAGDVGKTYKCNNCGGRF